MIEREIPGAGALTEIQIRDLSLRSLQTLKEIGPRIQWLHSYVTEDKVYCIYLAPDEDTVREHARRTGIPADRVSAVRRLIDPANLKLAAPRSPSEYRIALSRLIAEPSAHARFPSASLSDFQAGSSIWSSVNCSA